MHFANCSKQLGGLNGKLNQTKVLGPSFHSRLRLNIGVPKLDDMLLLLVVVALYHLDLYHIACELPFDDRQAPWPPLTDFNRET